jgi:hypothetical protein
MDEALRIDDGAQIISQLRENQNIKYYRHKKTR